MGRTGIFAARCVTVADIRLVFRPFLGNLFAVVPHIPHGRSAVHTPQQTAEQGNRAALAAAPSCRVVVHPLHGVPRLLRNQRLVGVFHLDPFGFRFADLLVVFVGHCPGLVRTM